jgi:hypothetical protein
MKSVALADPPSRFTADEPGQTLAEPTRLPEGAPRFADTSDVHAPSFGSGASIATLLLVACGTLGGIIFTAVYLAEGATRAGYDAVSQPISALSLGPGGLLQRGNFALFGVLMIISAVGWRRLLAGAPAALAFPVTRAVVGIGLVLDAMFSQDAARGYPPGTATTSSSLHGQLHNAAAVVVIVGLAAGCFILGRRFSTDPAWRSWRPVAYATGLLTLVFITAFGLSGGSGGLAGVFERLAGGVNSMFGLAVLIRLLIQSRRERCLPAFAIHGREVA